ncbi:MAG: tyrosine-protein phosphatase [Halioglobus sp.]
MTAERFRFHTNACRVERMPDQDYLLVWSGSEPDTAVTVYIADYPEQFYRGVASGQAVAHTREHGVKIANPDVGIRHYFYLVSEGGDAIIIAERKLPLLGSPNFRDLGGYEARDGRRMRWGKVFRSGKLSALSDVDIAAVNRLGLTLVCDFRKVTEQQLDPSRLGVDHSARLQGLPISPGSADSFMDNLLEGIIDIEDAAGLMEDINRDFVINHLHQYARMFELLLEQEHKVLIHCASGKDRTGFAAALILDVLGVPEQDIVEDYLLTNTHFPVDEELQRLSKSLTDRSGKSLPESILRPLLEVHPDYINACFHEIDQRYQSREHFYEQALDLDEAKIALLRDRYLH